MRDLKAPWRPGSLGLIGRSALTPPYVCMKVVTLRERSTGRVFAREAVRTAMELPSEWPDDANVIVTGDDLEWLRADAERIVKRSVTRRLEQFFAGERCLVPSKRVSDDGRTLWMVVEVVMAVHLGAPPSDE